MIGLTEGTGHLFYDGMPFLMFIILICYRYSDRQRLCYKLQSVTHMVKYMYVCQIQNGDCGRCYFLLL